MKFLTVVLDACVLYPAPLRDLLMRLAARKIFQPKWSNEIHREWIENLLLNRSDLTRAQLERTRELMNQFAQDALTEDDYLSLLPKIQLPDPNDRHVLALAVYTKADKIATFNLKDFPKSVLQPLKIEAVHPDLFLLDLCKSNSNEFIETLRIHRAALGNPPKSVEQYLETLEKQGLSQTVKVLREWKNVI